jgi:thiamine pyrophosphate-dependent acetolactate synthase large subunit-like protein
MTSKDKSEGVNRREFLSSATAGVAAAALAKPAAAQEASEQAGPQFAAVTPPSAAAEAMEYDVPAGYSAAEAREYFVRHPGSDFMIDVVKDLDLEYITTNPGSSFRGFHESLVNYGGNSQPELLTCPHEEQAIAMAHGYAKVAGGKPIGVLVHGTVGLQHASMAMYNAWCDRAPMVVLGGNHLDATERRSGVEWSHSAQDAARVVRDFTKWDDAPMSLQHFSESMARAYKIATTPPMGPTVVIIDGHLQEAEMEGEAPTIPGVSPTQPPRGDAGALEEAARWLVEAESPVIVVDLMAHDQDGVDRLIELAEELQAPVVNQSGRMNFPNNHYLSQGSGVVAQADVILGLELYDTWGVLNTLRDRVHRDEQRRARPDARVIDIGVKDLFTKSNYQSFQRYHASDLSIAGDAQATLPSLTEEVRQQMSRARRASNSEREQRWRTAHAQARTRDLDAARYGWDASPISTARLYMELWQLVKDRDWALVSDDGQQSRWARRLWTIDRHYQHIGRSGGAGLGYGAPSAVGAALAHRAEGRLAINVQRDGDLMYVPGILWTAAHHEIPLLNVTHNNRGYHQEFMHLQRMAARRQRGIDGSSHVGNELNNPAIDFAQVSSGMGVWSTGPITDPSDLRAALVRALDVVDQGEPALVDCVCQPR